MKNGEPTVVKKEIPDVTVMSELAIAGTKAGADREFYGKLTQIPELFKKVVEFVKEETTFVFFTVPSLVPKDATWISPILNREGRQFGITLEKPASSDLETAIGLAQRSGVLSGRFHLEAIKTRSGFLSPDFRKISMLSTEKWIEKESGQLFVFGLFYNGSLWQIFRYYFVDEINPNLHRLVKIIYP
jgi:hypothetical protein